jgi:tetratricopeptide (TPR) repeat protein
VDDVCDHFEIAWKAGLSPRIEDYLGATTEPERSTLLDGLLVLDLVYRRRRGEQPALGDYLGRFPESVDLLRVVLSREGATVVPDWSDTIASWRFQSPRRAGFGDSDEALWNRLAKESRDEVWPEIAGYDILAELGRGGMGVVYQARQQHLNRLVALKMIRAGLEARPGDRERFRVEAEAVARLHHANILQIYDIGEAAGHPYVALELLEGGRLADRLAGTPQPGRPAAELMITLARAIHAAHQAGIVHRDLKPSNVLFDRDGTPKIVDFGLAKRLEQEDGQTLSGQIVGTPSYMAPEQAAGRIKEVGPAADVYALGAVLYELLTGRPPFKATTPMQTVMQVVHDEPVPPSRLLSRVPRDLETICLKCLCKEPSRRYSSARELADDLERYLSSTPIRARRTPVQERAVKWAKRRPLAATLLGLGLMAAVALAGGWMRYDSLRRQWREAERVAKMRFDTDQLFVQAQGHLTQRRWDDARVVLTRLLTRLGDEPELANRRIQTEDLLKQAERGRAEQDTEAQASRRYQDFLELRKEALFEKTRYSGLNSSRSAADTRRSARKALDLFAASGPTEPWTLATLPACFSARERAEINEGCYELLLSLADAAESPDQGSRFLDQASRLDPTPTRAYFLRLATCLTRQGDGPGAERARLEAERLQPASALDHFLTGQERYNHPDHPDPSTARQHFEATVRFQPDHFGANCLLAVCCLQLNEPREALPHLRACLNRAPDFAWLYVLRGYTSTLIAARDRVEAARSAPGQGNTVRADERLQFQAAEEDFEQAGILLEYKPDNELRYELLVYRGFMWFQRRELDRAAADFREAIKLNDRDPRAFSVLARVEQDRDQPDKAIQCYDRAIDANPDFAPLYRGRADISLGRKDLTQEQRAQVLSDLEQAIEKVAPGDPVVARDHTNRARLLHQEGRDQDALIACDAAVKIAPDYPEAHHLRLRILLELKRYRDLLGLCEVLLARGKASPELYELRALARTGQGDYGGAIEDITKVLELRPDQTPLLTRRGRLYLATQAQRLAWRDFDRALELDPANRDAFAGRGEAQIHLGDYRAAVADAQNALDRGVPDERLAYNTARIYAQAAQAVGSETRRRGRDAVVQFNKYQDRAVDLVTEAMRQIAPEQRAEFWRNQIQGDPAFQPLLPRLSVRLKDLLTAGTSTPSGSNHIAPGAAFPSPTHGETPP